MDATNSVQYRKAKPWQLYVPYTGRESVLKEILDRDTVLYHNRKNENIVNVPAGSYCIFF